MTIQVVEQGQIPAERPYAGTCDCCKTKIECLREDGRIVHSRDQRDPDYIAVKCPLCKNDISCYPLRSKPPLPRNK